MTDRKFFVQTMKDEIPRFDRVFKSLPDKPKNWRGHPGNKNAMGLVKDTMVYEATTFPIFLKTGSIDFAKAPKPKGETVSKLAEIFKKAMEQSCRMAEKMDESKWQGKAQMLFKGKVEWETTRGNMAWGLLLDLIHHRGQLSTYIRPLGGKVPSIYGPSGDSK